MEAMAQVIEQLTRALLMKLILEFDFEPEYADEGE